MVLLRALPIIDMWLRRLRALLIINTRLRTLLIINTSLHALRTCAPLPSAISALRAFVLSFYKSHCFSSRAKNFDIVGGDHEHMQRCELSVLDVKHPIWANLAQKIKIASLKWNLVPRAIRICRIHWWCSLFLFSARDSFFGQIQNCQFEL